MICSRAFDSYPHLISEQLEQLCYDKKILTARNDRTVCKLYLFATLREMGKLKKDWGEWKKKHPNSLKIIRKGNYEFRQCEKGFESNICWIINQFFLENGKLKNVFLHQLCFYTTRTSRLKAIKLLLDSGACFTPSIRDTSLHINVALCLKSRGIKVRSPNADQILFGNPTALLQASLRRDSSVYGLPKEIIYEISKIFFALFI